jgi:RHS repeat-associated protein
VRRSYGNLWKVHDPFGGRTIYTYDQADRLQTRTLPNGVVTTWTFDSRDRLLSIVHRNSGGAVLSSFTYEHPVNAVGEPSRITREDNTYIKLFYDPALRLEREEYYSALNVLQSTRIYTYDDAGNRTSRTIDASVDSYAIDPVSGYQLSGINGPGPDDSEFGYVGGRMTSLSRDGDPWTLAYNGAGQLTAVNYVTGANVDHSYEYDALGNRVAAAANGTVNRKFLVAPAAQHLGAGALDVPVQHLATDGSGSLLNGWIYAGENPILLFDSLGNVIYYLEDASDSIAAVVNASQAKTADYRYDAFGNLLTPVTPNSSAGGDFGYHGAWREFATGLYDMRARTYDPETGRFTTPDPVAPDPQQPETYNTYAFANSNPHLFSDPTGLFSVSEISVSSSIQSSLNSLRTAIIANAKKQAVEHIEEFVVDFVVDQLALLLPSFGNINAGSLIRSIGAGDAGKWFQSGVTSALQNVLPFKGLWIEPGVLSDGSVEDNGFLDFDPSRFIKPKAGVARPDYLINRSAPADPNPERTWLLGDIALTGNRLYKKYVSPGKQQTQWNAIINHAEKHGLRISVFFTFFAGDESVAYSLKEKIGKEALEQGTFAFIISLKG